MKSKNKALEVNEYKIKFIYDNPQNVHTRYTQAVSLEQVESNLNKMIEAEEYELLSIEKYNRYSKQWEEQEINEVSK
tara:strand:- start:309 stop:539 length:231 start_codon:yes stop_codon:yes gene_type:complete